MVPDPLLAAQPSRAGLAEGPEARPVTRTLHETLDGARIRELLEELGREASSRRFEVAPNPCVGAAVLAGGREIARGFHTVWGGSHAEVAALEAAERSGVPRESWDWLVVTLEPCSSHGKTPPCVDAILRSGVRGVVVGGLDPDLRHCGRGVKRLQEEGLEVIVLEGEWRLARTSPHFLAWTGHERLRRPRPWTIAKWAQTRTGQLRPPEGVGDGRWISGPEARAEVALLRGRVDAIVTGVGTVLADDPRLSVRPPGRLTRPPLRVVLDSYLRTPPGARLFQPCGPQEAAGRVHLLALAGFPPARERALRAAGAEIHGLHTDPGSDHLSLRDVQEWLWQRGVERVLLECGPTLLLAHLERDFVDQLRVYTGSVNGGQGPSLGPWLSQARLSGRLDRECGEDAVLEAFLG
jgi:diaminohydroxyphosphoribosylaminopyrimidine deaminase/5-amino-6-(5-phosphoribosylamino)uracil reductase